MMNDVSQNERRQLQCRAHATTLADFSASSVRVFFSRDWMQRGKAGQQCLRVLYMSTVSVSPAPNGRVDAFCVRKSSG